MNAYASSLIITIRAVLTRMSTTAFLRASASKLLVMAFGHSGFHTQWFRQDPYSRSCRRSLMSSRAIPDFRHALISILSRFFPGAEHRSNILHCFPAYFKAQISEWAGVPLALAQFIKPLQSLSTDAWLRFSHCWISDHNFHRPIEAARPNTTDRSEN